MGNIIINPFLHSNLSFSMLLLCSVFPDITITIFLVDDAEKRPGGRVEEVPVSLNDLSTMSGHLAGSRQYSAAVDDVNTDTSQLTVPSLSSGLEEGG